jgi:hypothetical protein
MRRVRSTALSKAISSIPTCGYVDRRDKIDHHVRGSKQDLRSIKGGTHSLIVVRKHLSMVVSFC